MVTANNPKTFLFLVVLSAILIHSSYQACHATCLLCDLDNSANNCTSCDGALFRNQAVSPSACICDVGYIDAADTSVSPTCISGSCSYTCPGLCRSTAAACTACNGGMFRTLSGTTCPCDLGYFDNGVELCVICDNKCKSCTTAATTCTDCYNTQYRSLVGSSCNCLSGYYEAGSDICGACSYKCSTCSGASTTCTACAGSTTRTTTPTCACATKYYDDGSSPSCQACHYSCATCTTGLTCDSCNTATKKRSYSSATSLCACMNRYFDAGTSTQLCSSCHATCLTCTAGANTNCLSCNSASHRVFNSATNKCDCDVGYYQTAATTELCAACHYSCATCTGGAAATNCATCNSLLFRTYLASNTSCPCNTGYYDKVGICTLCHSSCLTCTNSTACATCPSGTQIVNSTTGFCECPTTKYWDSGTSACVTCGVTCATCSITGTNCTSCDGTTNKRILSGNTCLCKTGYYDNSVAVCATCPYSCMTCDTTGCLTCNATAKRTKSGTACLCESGYYDNGSTQLCAACRSTCLTCTTSATNCQTCDGSTKFRVLSGSSCVCIGGYFDPGTGSSVCSKCSNKCTTCTTTFGNCGACAGTGTRGAAPNCLCNAKFYDDGVSADCVACHYSCKTCSTGTTCSTCDSTKFRFVSPTTGRCACNVRYYDDGANELCAVCHATCLTCTGAANTNCLTCNSLSQRTFNSGTGKCDCLAKFYETSPTTQLCGTCHATCLTCSGTSATSCLTCSASQQRTFDGTNKCNCLPTFYLDASFVCQSCHTSCATCTTSSACATCPYATQTINAVTGICECSTITAWDSGTTSCISCHYSCTTCSLATTNCTTCNSATNFRTKVGTTCPCFDGYYDNSVAICVVCDHRCLTCDINGCLTCNSVSHRTISGVTCPCNDGYYDDGTYASCQDCQYSCKTCTAATACTGCQPLLFRVMDANTGFCGCDIKFYEDPASLTCQPCLYSCATCSVGDRCLTCESATNHRVFNTSTTLCQCPDRFYDDGANQLCLACLYDCLTCPDYSACSSCDLATDHRELSSATSRCVCVTRYWEDTGVVPAVCMPCHYSCMTCQDGTATTCVTCNTNSYRVENVATHKCDCLPGYYDDGSNQLCIICHYSCQTCVDAVSCATCDSGTLRTLATLCDCPPLTYYDDGSNKYCLSCHYSCSTCTDTLSCTACDAVTNFRTTDPTSSYCKCLDGYYDDGYTNQLCLLCPYPCKTCTNASVCLTCDTGVNKRYRPAELCPCVDGFYDDGASHALCATCQYSCQTCVLGTQCVTCNVLKFREFQPSSRLCACLVGYYDTGASVQLCEPCSYTCLTCATASIHCLTCNSSYFRTIDSTAHTCPCDQYYYDDLINPLCLSCHYSCMTCVDSSTCSSCDPTKHRQADPNTDLCKCSIRYYDDGNNNQICNPCHGTCLECTNATACTACDTTALRLLNTTANYAGVISPFCVCRYKYYGQTNLQAICLACHYSCGECSGPNNNNCLYCSADSHRVLNTTSKICKCIAGYYDNGAIQTCLICHTWCTTCTNPTTTTCSSCAPTYFLKLDVTTCYDTCPNYFFGKTSTMTCVACSSHCVTCTSATSCTVCDPGFPLYQAACLASCPTQSTFLDAPNNQCIDCPTGCLTCNSLIYCTSCMTDYYLDTMLHLCFDCNQYCKRCTGPAQNQCIDCQYPLYLNNNQCFNITCPYGQYIDSHQGCLQCKNLFTHSLTCNISVATLCEKQYKVKNGLCEYCTNVNGYAITSTGDCSEVCGDGLLIEYQCDDGNNLDGDGCSSNCLAEEGWHCVVDGNGKSVCALDGVVKMSLNKVFKYGGQNKVKIYLTLAIPIRLNSRFFLLTFIGLQDPNSISWQFTQSSTNLRDIDFTITYLENIDNKKFQLSYDTTRRRLLQSVTLTFTQDFTLTSFPPANYYPETQINSYNGLKSVIYVGSVVLLCLCALSLVFVRKMYVHLFVAATVPAQIFVLYGLAAEGYTDWIKWSLLGIDYLAFIGGFKVGTGADLATTAHFGYSIQVTKNMGVTCCVMLGLWVLYGIVSFCKRYLCRGSQPIMKLSMYLRYFIITLQFCFLPHMTYSAVNALYNSSLTSQTSSINVCLAIFVNVYLLGLITALFLLSKSLYPNQLMLQSQEVVEVSMEQNLSVDDARPRSRQLNSTKHLFFLNGDKQRDEMSINREQKETQKYEFQSSRSQLAIMDRPKSKRVFDSSKEKQKQKEEKKSDQNEGDIVQQYEGVGYYYNHLEIYKKVQEKYLNEWLIYDYAQLYATGGYKQNLPPKKSLQGQLLEPDNEPQKSKQLVLQKYQNTKFYLPLTILRIYLISLVASVLQSQPFILFLAACALNLAYFLYLLLIRPFKFGVSNLRVITGELFFVALSGLMAYYMYSAGKGVGYSQGIETAVIVGIAAIVLWADFMFVMEIFGAWRMEIWNKLEPCLVALRLRGARKVMKYKKSRPNFKLVEKAPQPKKEQQKQEEMDAFFARMLKKQSIQKQYRRERMLQNPKHPQL